MINIKPLLVSMARNQLLMMIQIQQRCEPEGEYYLDYQQRIKDLEKLLDAYLVYPSNLRVDL